MAVGAVRHHWHKAMSSLSSPQCCPVCCRSQTHTHTQNITPLSRNQTCILSKLWNYWIGHSESEWVCTCLLSRQQKYKLCNHDSHRHRDLLGCRWRRYVFLCHAVFKCWRILKHTPVLYRLTCWCYWHWHREHATTHKSSALSASLSKLCNRRQSTVE